MISSLFTELLEPITGERPTAFADRIGRLYSNGTSSSHKKQFGQYLTPVAVADFMASLVECETEEIRILDPGAGSGILACAVVEALVNRNDPPSKFFVDTCECDRELLPILDSTLRYLSSYLSQYGVNLTYRINSEDFVLEHAPELRRRKSLFSNNHEQVKYDVVIGNPPYFKLPKTDPRARAAADVVHGQPNIYALFMAVSEALLKPEGELVFITPRSFTSGPYFQRFREYFFERVQIEAVHVFNSRKDAFGRDGVLQENMILKGRSREHWAKAFGDAQVQVSASTGATDIGTSISRTIVLSDLIDMDTKDKILRIPSTEEEHRIINLIDTWVGSPSKFGMQVSTGPVVPFRAVELLSMQGNVPNDHAPLLWLQNVHPMQIEWPTNARGKPQYIAITSRNADPLLVRDRNYVLLRRFSAKEERRRLVAAPLLAGQLGSEEIGIENHLNYVHRPGDSLTEEEAIGLSILYNSEFMDMYFRVLNGSTQVSATEVRKMPLPALDVIKEIGRRGKGKTLNHSQTDKLAKLAFTGK